MKDSEYIIVHNSNLDIVEYGMEYYLWQELVKK